MYKLSEYENIVIRKTDGAAISLPAAESEGYAYQEWLNAGNTPEPYAAASMGTPQSVSARQGIEALIDAGLWADIQSYVNAIPGVDGQKAQNKLNRASEFRRDDILLIAVAHGHGLTDDQIDQLFTTAASL